MVINMNIINLGTKKLINFVNNFEYFSYFDDTADGNSKSGFFFFKLSKNVKNNGKISF